MDARTIALHGGGDLVIGGGPPIERVIHGWIYKEGVRGTRGGYGFMLSYPEAEQLLGALRSREETKVKTFVGHLVVTHGEELVFLWFYPWGKSTPECCARLYGGAIDCAAEAIAEQLEETRPWLAAEAA